MKLCKNCKNCIPGKILGLFTTWEATASNPLRCARNRIKHISPVDGFEWWSEPERCDYARCDRDVCGPDGKYWEAK